MSPKRFSVTIEETEKNPWRYFHNCFGASGEMHKSVAEKHILYISCLFIPHLIPERIYNGL